MQFIVSLGYLTNELNLLNKLLAIAIKPSVPSEPERMGAHTTTGVLLRLLAGLLKEGWTLLQCAYWGGKVSRDYETHLPSETRAAMERIKRYFSGGNLIDTIRSAYAFHLPVTKLAAAVTALSPEDDFDILFAEANGNCLYWGSEALAMWELCQQAGAGDAEDGMDRVFREVLEISDAFSSLAAGCIHVFATRHDLAGAGVRRQQFELADIHDIESMRLPFFVGAKRTKNT